MFKKKTTGVLELLCIDFYWASLRQSFRVPFRFLLVPTIYTVECFLLPVNETLNGMLAQVYLILFWGFTMFMNRGIIILPYDLLPVS